MCACRHAAWESGKQGVVGHVSGEWGARQVEPHRWHKWHVHLQTGGMTDKQAVGKKYEGLLIPAGLHNHLQEKP